MPDDLVKRHETTVELTDEERQRLARCIIQADDNPETHNIDAMLLGKINPVRVAVVPREETDE